MEESFIHTLDSPSEVNDERVIHVTIPFCDSICSFCRANRFPADNDDMERYMVSLEREMALYSRKPFVCTGEYRAIYIHGGTPTVLGPERLGGIIDRIYGGFPVSDDVEITVESTFHNLDSSITDMLIEKNVSRIYLGIQTLHNETRNLLNRNGSGEDCIETIEKLKSISPFIIRADLMYGLPGQNMDMWRDDIRTVIELGIENLSLFCLRLYPDTRLGRSVKRKMIPGCPGPDILQEMFDMACSSLLEAGYIRQNRGGFYLPGTGSQYYNMYYQQKKDAVGLGVTNWFRGRLGNYDLLNVKTLEDYYHLTGSGRFPFESVESRNS